MVQETHSDRMLLQAWVGMDTASARMRDLSAFEAPSTLRKAKQKKSQTSGPKSIVDTKKKKL